MYELIELDPRALAEYPGNVREDPGDLSGMVETMQRIGVVVPIIVCHVGDGTETYKVLAGKRRTAAAIKAGLTSVPCLNTGSSTDDGEDQIRSLIENVQRKDLTPAEEAEGWRQLQLGGLDDAAIARVVGLKVERVTAGLTVGASKVAVAVSKRHDLTLEQALVLAEFDDDKEAVKALTVAAVKEPGQFPHVASRLRQNRDERREREAEIAKLDAKGIVVFDGRIEWDGTKGPRYLSDLTQDGAELTAKNHRKCPGHAVQITRQGFGSTKMKLSPVCVSPAEFGHKLRRGTSTPNGSAIAGSAEAEKAKAQRAETIAKNKLWRAAEPVRRDFVRALLKQKAAPKSMLLYVTREIMGDPSSLAPMNRDRIETMLTDLTGVAAGKTSYTYSRHVGLAIVDKLGGRSIAERVERLPLVLFAQIAAVRETLLGADSWRLADASKARYLSFLANADVGYTLSDIERELVEKAAKAK